MHERKLSRRHRMDRACRKSIYVYHFRSWELGKLRGTPLPARYLSGRAVHKQSTPSGSTINDPQDPNAAPQNQSDEHGLPPPTRVPGLIAQTPFPTAPASSNTSLIFAEVDDADTEDLSEDPRRRLQLGMEKTIIVTARTNDYGKSSIRCSFSKRRVKDWRLKSGRQSRRRRRAIERRRWRKHVGKNRLRRDQGRGDK